MAVLKKRLAHRIVRMYHGEAAAADGAQHDFEAQFSRRETPEHLEEFGPAELAKALGHAPNAGIVEVLVASGIAASKSAARRLVEQRAVSVDGERVQRARLRGRHEPRVRAARRAADEALPPLICPGEAGAGPGAVHLRKQRCRQWLARARRCHLTAVGAVELDSAAAGNKPSGIRKRLTSESSVG